MTGLEVMGCIVPSFSMLARRISYGVYGYENKSPDILALELELTTAGVYKARDTALKHLQKLYRESNLYIWHRAYQITKTAASKGRPNRSYLSDL